jgi:excisionase family DNA binding protein
VATGDARGWMRPADVAGRLGLAVNTVYELLAAGKLGSYRVGPSGGRHRIAEEHLEAYLRSCESGPRAKAPPPAPPRHGRRGKAERLDGKPLKHY